MLFSHPEVIRLMGRFECAWQELRPVPKVSIDFGDGRVLERTLKGNIATWFLTPEGEALDVVTGLVNVPSYAGRLSAALQLSHEVARAEGGGAQRWSTVREHHRVRLSLLELTNSLPLIEWSAAPADFPVAVSKMRLEGPILEALSPPSPEVILQGTMARDAELSRTLRDPVVHRLFATSATFPDVQEVTRVLYKDLLHVDLDDPWLGLAPLLNEEQADH